MNNQSFMANIPTEIERRLQGVSLGATNLPLEIIAKEENLDLASWIKEYKDEVDRLLYQHGALLFRNFNVNNPIRLQNVAQAYSQELLDYTERGAPRISLGGKVFTSTEYAKEEVIPLHHEMSYSNNWPSKLFFCCQQRASEGGYTPVACDRKVIRKIPEAIKRKFLDKKVMYVRNYGLGVDMSWQEAFATESRSQVEKYLNQTNTSFEWIGKDRLRTRAVRQVVATHPVTNDTVWFNHAHLFHVSNMPSDVRDFLVEEFSEDGIPRNAFYGDGSTIEDSVLEEIMGIYNSEAVKFPWKEGDMLLLDNFLVSHGRTPFKGKRRICVAMSELYSAKGVDHDAK
ncbi:TauD/TfdA family dioxygenase [Pseudoalteromonas maricaloris]|uniref:TauD/TfdA family dioxygenase n=1 Tax=Pseudoalteromonas maricaloris TaxID=184924 RepID=UPI003C13D363